MPKVALIGGRSVPLNPVPAPFDRRTPSPNEFGAQLAAPLSRLGDILTRHAIKARSDADQVASLQASNTLELFIQKQEFDPKTGYLSQHGDEVWDLPERAAAEVNLEADRIFAGLGNEKVKQSFLVARGSALQSLDMRLRRHVLKEVESQDIAVTQATIDLSQASAINNALSPEFIRPEIDRIVAARRDFAKRWGIDKQITEAQISEEVSAVHVGVITRLLELGNDTQANDYFQVVGPGPDGADELNGTALITVEKALKEGTLRGVVQQTTDRIMTGAMSIDDAYAEARAIEVPEVREAVEDEVGRRLNQREAAAAENRKQTEITALNAIDRNPTLGHRAVDPATWATMDSTSRRSLQIYADAMAPGGGGVETDSASYYRLFQDAHGVVQPGDTRTPAQIQQAYAEFDLMTVRHLFDEVDWERLVSWQGTILLGGKDTEETFSTGRTNIGTFNNTLDRAGIERAGTRFARDEEAKKAVATLNDQYFAEIDQWQRDNQKKAPQDVVQQIIDDLIREVKDPRTGIGIPFMDMVLGRDRVRVGEILAEMTPEQQAQIEAALVANEMAVTRENIAKAWMIKGLK